MIGRQAFQQTSVTRLLAAGADAPAAVTAGAAPAADVVVQPVSPVSPPTRLIDVEFAPGAASQVLVGEVTDAADSLPVANTQRGNLFDDRNDTGLTWYLPTVTLLSPDTSFAFAADQTSVDAQGNPFNQASLTLAARASDPPDVQQARQQAPTARFQQIPFVSLGATLCVPYTDDSGNPQQHTLSGQIAPQGDGTFQITFGGLLGAAVIQAYQNLTQLGGLTVQFQLTYRIWRHIFRMRPIWAHVPPTPHPMLAEARGDAMVRLPVDDPPGPMPPQDTWIAGTNQLVLAVPLALTYAAGQYRSAFTLTVSGQTRAIIDVQDLRDFDVQRSEFRELTSLGTVSTRYPSFQRLYLGQVTGVVVAVPAAYGIVRSSSGCDARLDALVDTSSSTGSGTWFQFTSTIAPVLDPVDLAQLASDLLGIPEAVGRTLRLSLPTGLDGRWPASLDAPFATNIAFANGHDGQSLLVSFDIRDTGATPAVANANMFLAQLASPVDTPLFGQVSLRLDDVYAPAITAAVILNLHATSSSDDLSPSIGGSPPSVSVTNNAPFDLRLKRFAAYNSHSLTITPFELDLPAGQSTALPVTSVSDTATVLVERTIALADPFPRKSLRQYLEVHTETVQHTLHPVGINSTSVDFDANGIAELDIQITLDDLPEVSVPSVVLTPVHRVDSVDVQVPVESVVTGLSATLTIKVVATDSTKNRQVQVFNDFMEHPLLVLTPSALGS